MNVMVNAHRAQLAGAILMLSAVAISGTNLAFAQSGSSIFPTCTVVAVGYNSCADVGLAQEIGAILVACVVALAAGLGIAGVRHHVAAHA